MKRAQWWILLVTLFLLNVWIILNRNNGFKYYAYKTYSELYVADSMLRIVDIHFNEKTLDVKFSETLPATKWKLFTDSSFTADITSSRNILSIPLIPNSHVYLALPQDNQVALPVKLIVDHTLHEGDDDNEFIYCNIPGPGIETMPLSTWQTRISSFPNEELVEARRLLRDVIHITASDDDFSKTVKIGKYLRHLRYDPHGINVNSLALKPIDQIKISEQSNVDLVCGNYTAMFHFLGSIAGLTTRQITFVGPDGNWHYGIHYFNEVYLHKHQQWALVDNANNIFLPHDSTRFYNAADIKKMASVNGFANKLSYDLSGDSLRLVPYDRVNYFHNYYNLSDADLCYEHHNGQSKSLIRLAWQFYTIDRDYSLYSDKKDNDLLKIVIKYFLLLSLIVAVLLYLLWEMNKFGKKKQSLQIIN